MQRVDQDLIVNLIPRGARVLDLGCGNGDLLTKLKRSGVSDIRGVEIDDRCIALVCAKGSRSFKAISTKGLATMMMHLSITSC